MRVDSHIKRFLLFRTGGFSSVGLVVFPYENIQGVEYIEKLKETRGANRFFQHLLY